MTKPELLTHDEICKLYQAGKEPVVATFEQMVPVLW